MDLPYPASKNSVNNIGEGVGLGYNINVPLKKGFNDVDMLYVCDQLLGPVATAFKPEVVFVSAGYDAGKKSNSSSWFCVCYLHVYSVRYYFL